MSKSRKHQNKLYFKEPPARSFVRSSSQPLPVTAGNENTVSLKTRTGELHRPQRNDMVRERETSNRTDVLSHRAGRQQNRPDISKSNDSGQTRKIRRVSNSVHRPMKSSDTVPSILTYPSQMTVDKQNRVVYADLLNKQFKQGSGAFVNIMDNCKLTPCLTFDRNTGNEWFTQLDTTYRPNIVTTNSAQTGIHNPLRGLQCQNYCYYDATRQKSLSLEFLCGRRQDEETRYIIENTGCGTIILDWPRKLHRSPKDTESPKEHKDEEPLHKTDVCLNKKPLPQYFSKGPKEKGLPIRRSKTMVFDGCSWIESPLLEKRFLSTDSFNSILVFDFSPEFDEGFTEERILQEKSFEKSQIRREEKVSCIVPLSANVQDKEKEVIVTNCSYSLLFYYMLSRPSLNQPKQDEAPFHKTDVCLTKNPSPQGSPLLEQRLLSTNFSLFDFFPQFGEVFSSTKKERLRKSSFFILPFFSEERISQEKSFEKSQIRRQEKVSGIVSLSVNEQDKEKEIIIFDCPEAVALYLLSRFKQPKQGNEKKHK